jgi:hypothetical protein
MKSGFTYDVCFSFAGEDRKYVQKVADELTKQGYRVFYDENEKIELWGKDLYQHLAYLYTNAAKYCVVFISKAYAEKLWTSHELKNAQARAFKESKEYILPARFDNTELPGISPTTAYINLKQIKEKEFAKIVANKIGPTQKENYLPPNPDLLFKELERMENKLKIKIPKREVAEPQAEAFFEILQRMNEDEKHLTLYTLLHGCIAELPTNTHIAIDLLKRETDFPENKIIATFGGLKALGVLTKYVKGKKDKHLGKSPQIVLEYHLLVAADYGGNGTLVAYATVHSAVQGYCAQHGFEALMRLDFSNLSEASFKMHKH